MWSNNSLKCWSNRTIVHGSGLKLELWLQRRLSSELSSNWVLPSQPLQVCERIYSSCRCSSEYKLSFLEQTRRGQRHGRLLDLGSEFWLMISSIYSGFEGPVSRDTDTNELRICSHVDWTHSAGTSSSWQDQSTQDRKRMASTLFHNIISIINVTAYFRRFEWKAGKLNANLLQFLSCKLRKFIVGLLFERAKQTVSCNLYSICS